LLERGIMSAEAFHSGGVLERASPVLTFSTEASAPRAPEGIQRKRADTPTPVPVTRSSLQPPRRATLPVIPRIVRRTIVDGDAVLQRAAARALLLARVARTSAVGSMAIAGVLLAALGASAGVALRSLSDPSLAAPSPAVLVSDTTMNEHPLVRAPAPDRVERTAPDEAASAGPERAAPTAFHAHAGEPSHRSAPHSGHASPHHRGSHPTSSRPPTRHKPTSKPKPH
jgi:hypothetical protein